jgi:phosphoribosylaminoimidazole synthetase
MDLVNHCVNDVLVQNARPLFFLDYIASAKIIPEEVASIVSGMSAACAANGCALLGGETAEMPGVYHDGHVDVAGTLVGLAERDDLLPLATIEAGDVLIGVRSVSPHTNGYSLLRRIFAALPLDAMPAPLEVPLGDALLEPHRSYLPVLAPLLDGTERNKVKALIHITGGGLIENVPRVLPRGLGASVKLGSWPVPPLFQLVRDVSALSAEELHRTLNMGVGMVIVCTPTDVPAVQSQIAEDTWVIGSVVADDSHGVVLSGVVLSGVTAQ